MNWRGRTKRRLKRNLQPLARSIFRSESWASRLPGYRKNHNFWWDAKADPDDACADAGRDEEVMIVLEDVTGVVLRTKARWHDGSANQRNIHLTTVCVRCQ